MAKLEAKMGKSGSSSCDVFQTGKYQVKNITLRKSHVTKPPAELFIVSPLQKGTYPLLLFCHGFMLTNTGYTTLMHHIASHGYIVIAPQFYGLLSLISIPEEVKRAAQVTEWLRTCLPLVLPENVMGDADNLALSGHSRGGTTAFALALEIIDDPPPKPYKFKALIGIDPVAGATPWGQEPPHILKYIPRSFNMSIPVAVIGTEYGNQPLFWFIPACAPDGVNHWEFYNECKPPACHFLTRGYGHMDMMDDGMVLPKLFCKCGEGPKDPMRRCVGGIVVAFLRCYLDKAEEDLNAIVGDPSMAPIVLDPVIYVKE